jgi:hypothetical protein
MRKKGASSSIRRDNCFFTKYNWNESDNPIKASEDYSDCLWLPRGIHVAPYDKGEW